MGAHEARVFSLERFVMTLPAGVSRRGVLAAAAAATVAAPLAGNSAAQAKPVAGPAARPDTYDLTVLGTSDTHGNVFNWDYYKDKEYDDSAHNERRCRQARRPRAADPRRAGR